MTAKKKKQSGATNWKCLPGGFDALNTRHLYESSNDLGIPNLPHVALSAVPDKLYPYRTRLKASEDASRAGIHFFLDDYRFESIWRRPIQTLSGIQKWFVALTPDFSLYTDTPRAMQMWNVYRTRWVGCWWVANDITVIPTVSWSTPDSYDYAFLGLPERSVLAISTIGIKKDVSLKALFMSGFREMLTRLTPTKVLCYGTPHDELYDLCELQAYPGYWDSVKLDVRQYPKKATGHQQNSMDTTQDTPERLDTSFKLDF